MVSAASDMLEIELRLKLSKDASELLARRAAAVGKNMSEVASDLIEQAVKSPPAPDPAKQLAAIRSFAASMNEWAKNNLPPGHVVDDSRESIYEGRGE